LLEFNNKYLVEAKVHLFTFPAYMDDLIFGVAILKPKHVVAKSDIIVLELYFF
jgi:hypothetical protein